MYVPNIFFKTLSYQPSVQQPQAGQWPPAIQQPSAPQPSGPTWQQPAPNSQNQWQPQPPIGYVPPSLQTGFGGSEGNYEGSGSDNGGNYYPQVLPDPNAIPPPPTEALFATTTTAATTTTVKPTLPSVITSTIVVSTTPVKPKPPVEEATSETTSIPLTTTTVPPPFEPRQPLPDDEDYSSRNPDSLGPQRPPDTIQYPQPSVTSPPGYEQQPSQGSWDPNAPFGRNEVCIKRVKILLNHS